MGAKFKMKLPRRQFLHLAAGAAALPAVPPIAWAQPYPTRPVRWILGFTSGGTTDIISRLLGQQLSEQLGQPFIIESRPGAGTNIATEAVVRAPADGHTLLFVSAGPTVKTWRSNTVGARAIPNVFANSRRNWSRSRPMSSWLSVQSPSCRCNRSAAPCRSCSRMSPIRSVLASSPIRVARRQRDRIHHV
jgi:hypothetical protein